MELLISCILLSFFIGGAVVYIIAEAEIYKLYKEIKRLKDLKEDEYA